MMAKRILLLAGTGEARVLAQRLQEAGHEVMASLAGVTKQPKALPVETRIGGFGGKTAQTAFMTDQRFDLVVDATHPFAAGITARTAEICAQMRLPYLRFSRPEWHPEPGEIWQEVAEVAQLGEVIAADARVFLATGVQSQEIAAVLPRRVLYCRRVDDGPEPFRLSGGWITGRPPFTKEAEMDLFERLGITHLVAKNAGGPARAKLRAAHALGIPVAMISRPDGPKAPTVSCIKDVLDWVGV